MPRHERLLLEPAEAELCGALEQARTVAALPGPLPGQAEALVEVARGPEGRRLWRLPDDPDGRHGVLLAWWADRLGRRHVRVIGCLEEGRPTRVLSLDCPPEASDP